MFLRTLLLLSLLALALATLFAAPERAAAQVLPASLRVSPDYALEIQAAILQLPAEVRAEQELRQQLRKARRQLLIGSVLTVSGIINAAWMGNRNVCYESNKRLILPIVMGGLTAAAGVTLVVSGGVKLAGIPLGDRLRHPNSPGKRLGMAVGDIGLLALSQAALAAVSVGPLISCVTS